MAQRVGRGIALLFLDRGTRKGWVVSSTPRQHFTPGKDPVPILQEAKNVSSETLILFINEGPRDTWSFPLNWRGLNFLFVSLTLYWWTEVDLLN